tara:strand:- start:18152 stop:18454 length:303 start_codon:yes stop_codon:yes gene_type:complete
MIIQLIITVFVFDAGGFALSVVGLGSAFISALSVGGWAVIDGIPFGIRIFGWPFTLGAVFSGVILGVGLVKHSRLYGQAMAVLAVAALVFLGIMALGQGG